MNWSRLVKWVRRQKWLRGKKQRDLARVTYDELRLEKVKAEATEQRWLRDLQELEHQHQLLFEEAKRETSPTVQQVKARQIRDLRIHQRVQQANMGLLSKYIQVLTLFLAYKEQNSPFGNVIKGTDSLAIGNIVDEIVSDAELTEHKLDQFLKAFGEAKVTQSGVATGDTEIDAILAEFQIAAAADAIAAEAKITETWEPESPDREGV